MVELVSDEVRAAIMKTKKILENHHNPCLRRVIVKNMKSKQELKMDIAMNEMLRKLPGGENLYIANNGHIREKTANQMSFQNSFRSRIPPRRFLQPRTQASVPHQHSLKCHSQSSGLTPQFTPILTRSQVFDTITHINSNRVFDTISHINPNQQCQKPSYLLLCLPRPPKNQVFDTHHHNSHMYNFQCPPSQIQPQPRGLVQIPCPPLPTSPYQSNPRRIALPTPSQSCYLHSAVWWTNQPT